MGSRMLYERYDGVTPHWRGIRDGDGRWMLMISHNIDYGEGWKQPTTRTTAALHASSL